MKNTQPASVFCKTDFTTLFLLIDGELRPMATNEIMMIQQFSDASNAQFRIDAKLYLDGVETNRGALDLDRSEFPKEQFFDSMKYQIHHRIKKELLPDN